MNLKEAREIAEGLRDWVKTGILSIHKESGKFDAAIIILDDRVLELEAEKERIQLNLDACREVRNYAAFVLAGDANENVQDAADRIIAQRDALLNAADEMLNVIESTYYEYDGDAPNNFDMNRWHGAIQDAKTEGVALEENKAGGRDAS